jgi:hypothetical protein
VLHGHLRCRDPMAACHSPRNVAMVGDLWLSYDRRLETDSQMVLGTFPGIVGSW